MRSIALCFIMMPVLCWAQNLVPNGSFENLLGCPETVNELFQCAFWENFRETCDYFNSCSEVMGVPSNLVSFQESFDGSAYAGISCFWTASVNYREHLGIQLEAPLQIGIEYFVSARVSKAESTEGVLLACNNIGFRFSEIHFGEGNESPIDNFAHIYESNIIQDTSDWVLIGGSFISDESYDYLVIGNFFTDLETDTVALNSTASLNLDAYYLVDDVRVSSDSNFVFNSIKESLDVAQIAIGPNPFVNELSLISNKPMSQAVIYDISGNQVFLSNLHGLFYNKIDTSHLASGAYIIEVRESENLIQKLIIKSN